IKLKLQVQPLDILAMLLERPGDVVTREDLQKRLWASGTFVDFDHSLNPVIMRLRDVLDDSAETPRYVETLARRGYRFITPVDSPAMSVRIEIEESLTAPTAGESAAARNGIRALSRRQLIVKVGALLLVAVITSLAVWNLKPSRLEPVTRFAITLPGDQRLAGLDQPILALSPDGAQLAYVAIQSGNQLLYLRAMDDLESKPISGTEGATNPFFSPDGQWVGFFADGKLKKVSVSGGAVLILGDAPQPRGASWGTQGTIAFAPAGAEALQQVADAGGTPHALTRFEKGESSHRWPEFLNGGKAVLFAAAVNTGSWL